MKKRILTGVVLGSRKLLNYRIRNYSDIPLGQNFGSDRLMFASDFSPVLEYNTYRQTLELLHEEELGFSESDLEKIYHGNAMKIISERRKE